MGRRRMRCSAKTHHHDARLHLGVPIHLRLRRAPITTSPKNAIFIGVVVVSPVCPAPIDAHHRHYGRAVWTDPVVLRAITISWNNIIIPRRLSYHGHRDDKPLPWFTNDLGFPRLGCSTRRPQITQHQGRSESERYGHYPHAFILMLRPPCQRVLKDSKQGKLILGLLEMTAPVPD